MNSYHEHYKRWLQKGSLPSYLHKELLSLRNEEEIKERFHRYLEFGTAGIRGLLGVGTNRLNVYTIRRASFGFANYLLHTYPHRLENGIVIAYDSRHFSLLFAQETAAVFAAQNITVHLFEQLKPTPMLSYAVRHLHAIGGVMITASHNPPQYNGYKVYNDDGNQISPEVANKILEYIHDIQDELTLETITFDEGLQSGKIKYVSKDVEDTYYEHVLSLSLHSNMIRNYPNELSIVYTPLHGTGKEPVTHALQAIGFRNVHVVDNQSEPDPDFSSVSSPNPEEMNAFAEAITLGHQVNADLLLATDPDADRLGAVIKDNNGDYKFLTGNQIGALLLHYILSQQQQQGVLAKNAIVFKSIVTSDIGKKICADYHVRLEETLTGFKFIGEKIRMYEQAGVHTFLFGYEESYGYLIGDFVRDKDAVQTAMVIAEMTLYYKRSGYTLMDILEKLYAQYGYFVEDQISLNFDGLDGMETMGNIMHTLRNTKLAEIADLRITKTLDYIEGVEDLPPSDVLKLLFEDGSWIAFRPSGTEPKLKCYLSIVSKNATESQRKLLLIKQHIEKHLLSR